jgi:ABC-type microcin C transport system duplicated ATPase subunit YejF
MRSMQLRRLALVCGVAVAVGLGIVPGTRLARVAAQESGSGDSLSAEEVVRRLEENRVYETSRAEMSMTRSWSGGRGRRSGSRCWAPTFRMRI